MVRCCCGVDSRPLVLFWGVVLVAMWRAFGWRAVLGSAFPPIAMTFMATQLPTAVDAWTGGWSAGVGGTAWRGLTAFVILFWGRSFFLSFAVSPWPRAGLCLSWFAGCPPWLRLIIPPLTPLSRDRQRLSGVADRVFGRHIPTQHIFFRIASRSCSH